MNWIKKQLKRFRTWIIFGVLGVSVALAAGTGGGEPTLNELSKKEFIVGNEKVKVGRDTGNFVPEIKLEKWGEETYIRVWSEETGDDFATEVDGKVVWHNTDKSREYNFYPLTPEEMGNENGGFEFEIILKEKPATNVITLNIETKDLVFYYQPPLDEEYPESLNCLPTECDTDGNGELDSFRPENIVGSYAVYHKTKGGINSSLEKYDYMVGKAFQDFRPQLEDSDGWKVWGILHYEQISENLYERTVTIPQDFLDKAVYPIRHATGAEFGWQNEGASNSDIATQQPAEITTGPVAAPADGDGTLDKITAYIGGSGAADVKGLVYDRDSNGADSHDLIVTPSIIAAPAALDWRDFILSSESVTDANDYILAVIADASSLTGTRIELNYDTVGGIEFYSKDALVYDSPADPLSDAVSTGRKHSVFATYTPAGGAPAEEPRPRRLEIIIID